MSDNEIIRITDIPISRLISEYNDHNLKCDELIKKFKSNYPNWDEIKDTRIASLKFIRIIFQNAAINFSLIEEHFHNLKMWDNQKTDDIEKFKKGRLHFLEREHYTNIFYNFTERFEGFIRLVCKSLGVLGNKNDAYKSTINNLSKDIITELTIDQEYHNLMDLLFYARNTMHTEGIRTNATNTFTYRGYTYSFEEGKSLSNVLQHETFQMIFRDVIELMDLIIENEKINTIDKIEHYYSNIKFEYE